MQPTGRNFLAVIVFALSFWLVASMAFPLFAFGTPHAFRIAVGLACAALVTVPVWRASATPAPGLARSMLRAPGWCAASAVRYGGGGVDRGGAKTFAKSRRLWPDSHCCPQEGRSGRIWVD